MVPLPCSSAELRLVRPYPPVAAEEMAMARLDRDGVAIHYEVHGQGPAVLLSHGYSATCRMWDGQIDALRDRYQIIVWDMRGHGRHPARLRHPACGDRRTVARRLYVDGVPPRPSGDDARADDLRHGPRLPQRRGARSVEPALPSARRRPRRAWSRRTRDQR